MRVALIEAANGRQKGRHRCRPAAKRYSLPSNIRVYGESIGSMMTVSS